MRHDQLARCMPFIRSGASDCIGHELDASIALGVATKTRPIDAGLQIFTDDGERLIWRCRLRQAVEQRFREVGEIERNAVVRIEGRACGQNARPANLPLSMRERSASVFPGSTPYRRRW